MLLRGPGLLKAWLGKGEKEWEGHVLSSALGFWAQLPLSICASGSEGTWRMVMKLWPDVRDWQSVAKRVSGQNKEQALECISHQDHFYSTGISQMDVAFFKIAPKQWFSNYCLRSRSMIIAWGLVRNVNSQTLPQTQWIRTWGVGPLRWLMEAQSWQLLHQRVCALFTLSDVAGYKAST